MMDLIRFDSKDKFIKSINRVYKQRISVERYIASKHKHNKLLYFLGLNKWYLNGYCEACEKPATFMMDWKYSTNNNPNYRERLVCKNCKLNNRQRFMISYIKNIINKKPNLVNTLYIFEQTTIFYRYIEKTFIDKINIIGSEYLGPRKKPGDYYSGIRHEDALRLSFIDESIDIIVSNDVFEHIPNIEVAMIEAYRVLSKRGKLLFTIPFHQKESKTKQRAFVDNIGNINMILTPQYHANPLSNKGALVFYDFGWDILDICKNSGFKDVFLQGYYSMFHGYLGGGIQFIFVADKEK